ncbi:MAG: hypothetical protein FD170_3157 [Bacteroidetes bacterium]|nr:MAG: hypothetical protein FD170_3157 [Bacteroidota bacterium]
MALFLNDAAIDTGPGFGRSGLFFLYLRKQFKFDFHPFF